jgi:hypothetical protein
MQSEFGALTRNEMLDLVHRPCDANLIQFLWIFKRKKNYVGSFERYKARLVGDGIGHKLQVWIVMRLSAHW